MFVFKKVYLGIICEKKNLTELFVERIRVPAEKKMGPTFVHVYMILKSHEAHLHLALLLLHQVLYKMISVCLCVLLWSE